MDRGPENGMPPGQGQTPPSAGAPARGKEAGKSQELMQRQLKEMGKIIECMAANQLPCHDLPCQTPCCMPPHTDAVSIVVRHLSNLDKTNRLGCGSSEQVYGEKDEIDPDFQVSKDRPESSDFSSWTLFSQAAVADASALDQD